MQTQNFKNKILELEEVKSITPNLDFLKIIPRTSAEKAEVVIFDGKKSTLFVITTNNHPQMVSQIMQKVNDKGYKLDFYYTDKETFSYILSWYDQLEKMEEKSRKEMEELKTVKGKEAIDMIKKVYNEKHKYSEGGFIEEIIRLSYKAGSSDLHFQAEEHGVVMRLRKDGVLKDILTFSYQDFKKYLTKLKFMSGARLNVDYVPQDGRFDFEINRGGETFKIDVRVSFMPGLRGENIVMRFLDTSKGILSFSQIGFMGSDLETLKNNLEKNSGIIFVTGPTGSGKTTSLYSMINYLNDPSKKIITLEDPVEYEIEGIQQSQINEKKGYTYEEGLKSILRQDPDVILVGEIRTLETAEIAINAALTGHLVLSTLHTNNAIEAISRLLNMGVKPYMLAPSLNLIIGQRLLRKLDSCNKKRDANLAEKQEVETALRKIKDATPSFKQEFDGKIPQPVGCEKCGYDGFEGRIAAVETFEVNEDIKNIILNNGTALNIYSSARQGGFTSMKEDAYIKMLQGHTTLDEIRRVL